MKNLIIAIAVLAIVAGVALARGPEAVSSVQPYDGQKSRADVVYSDDLETGAPGWTHGDGSAQPIYWHTSPFMAYSGDSWYCGDENLTADGGYGNLWKQYLTTPYVDITGAYAVLFYQFRNDSELNYDFSYVRAESAGAWVNLNRGYDGSIPWGQGAYFIGNKDNPARVQFFFESDPAYSDADGLYLSVGGAFSVDDVMIMDYPTATLFLDDADGNIFMTPSVPPASGDFWYLTNSLCKSWSPTHAWTCTAIGDSTTIPPNLNNWLASPIVDISGYACVQGCTLDFARQIHMSGAWGGSWQEFSTSDGGATWYQMGWWYGNQCEYGFLPCDWLSGGWSIIGPGAAPDGDYVGVMWVMLTDSGGNSCDPVACPNVCDTSIYIDDVAFLVTECPSPVEESSWGHIKSMYR
jgi:hypothetical protein